MDMLFQYVGNVPDWILLLIFLRFERRLFKLELQFKYFRGKVRGDDA